MNNTVSGISFIAIFLASFLSSNFRSMDTSHYQADTSIKFKTADSTQYWKDMARRTEQQALQMAKAIAEQSKLQNQKNLECRTENESLRKLVEQQKKEIGQLKAKK